MDMLVALLLLVVGAAAWAQPAPRRAEDMAPAERAWLGLAESGDVVWGGAEEGTRTRGRSRAWVPADGERSVATYLHSDVHDRRAPKCDMTAESGKVDMESDPCIEWLLAPESGRCVELNVTKWLGNSFIMVYDGEEAGGSPSLGQTGIVREAGLFTSSGPHMRVAFSEWTAGGGFEATYRAVDCPPRVCARHHACYGCSVDPACVWDVDAGRCDAREPGDMHVDAGALCKAGVDAARRSVLALAATFSSSELPPLTTESTPPEYCAWRVLSCADWEVVAVSVQSSVTDGTLADWSGFPQLAFLSMSSQALSIALPWPEWPHLRVLLLEMCCRAFEFVSAFPEWPLLEVAHLGTVGARTPLPALRAWPRVRSLSLNANAFCASGEQTELPELREWPLVQFLDMGDTHCGGVLHTLHAWPAIQVLRLHANEFEGALPPLHSWAYLTELTLQDNHFTSEWPAWPSWPRLARAGINQAGFRGHLPPWPAGGFPKLEDLYLNNNRFHGTIPPAPPGTFPSLVTLSLAYNDLHGTVPTTLLQQPAVDRVFLSGNRLSQLDPAITMSPTVRVLSLDRNELEGGLPFGIFTASSIDLSHNRLTKLWLDNTQACPGCKTSSLRLAYNNLGSDVGVLLSQLDELIVLDASHNRFAKWNPYTGDQSPLSIVDLSFNQLDTDPALSDPFFSFHYAQLQVLILSHNMLPPGPINEHYGEIPTLSRLEVVDSGLHATPGQGTACAPPPLQDACFPSYLVPSGSRTVGNADCFELAFANNTESSLVTIDDSYFNGTNCLCKPYHVLRGGECVHCDDRVAYCPGGRDHLIMAAKEGYWGSPRPAFAQGMVRCKLTGVCNPKLPDGSVNIDVSTPCAPGHTGRLCAVCEADHFAVGSLCLPCGSPALAWLIPTAFSLCIIGYVAYLYVVRDTSTGLVKIALAYVQVLRVLPSLGTSLPSSLAGCSESTSSLSLHLSGIECMVPGFSDEDRFWMVMASPLVVAAGIGVVFLVGKSLFHVNAVRWRRRNVRVALFLLFTAYLYVCTTVLRALPCEYDRYSAKHWFAHFPNMRCASTLAASPSIRRAAVAFFFTHVLGIPALLGGALYLHRKQREREEVASQLGFLFEGYRPAFWWFEAVILARRVGVAMALSLAHNATALLPLVMILILLASLIVQRSAQPYASTRENLAESASLVVLITTFAVATAFFDDALGATTRTVLGSLLITANVLTMAWLVWALAHTNNVFTQVRERLRLAGTRTHHHAKGGNIALALLDQPQT